MSAALRPDEVELLKESLLDLKRQIAQLKKRGGTGVVISDDGEEAAPTPAVVWHKDVYTPGAPITGATLTYTPVAGSLQITMNTAVLLEGPDFTVSDDEVTFACDDPSNTPDDGDVIEAHYQRTDVTPDTPTVWGAYEDVNSWRYANGLGSSTTYAAAAFDDSAWSVGPGPFGWGGYTVATVCPHPSGLDVWTRKTIVTFGGDLTFSGQCDNNLTAYIDGVSVGTVSNPAGGPFAFTVSGISAGEHVVAIRGTDDNVAGGILDVQIAEVT